MIVDVMDIHISNIVFDKKVNYARYSRGERIYDYEDVTIKSVDKVKDEYIVKASVNGTYGRYTTMLRIANDSFAYRYSCTCQDYQNGNICKHIVATKLEVEDPHRPSTKEGEKRRQEEEKKRLEEARKRLEYESKYSNFLDALNRLKSEENIKPIQELNLSKIKEEVNELKKQGNKTRLASSVKIEYYAELNNYDTLKLSFKIGESRMYVLNNICEFYNAYRNNQELHFGKQLCFIPSREIVREEDRELFDYIIKYAEMIEYNSKYNNNMTPSYIRKSIYLSGNDIDKFFDANRDKGIIFHYAGDSYKWYFTDEKLDISCELKREEYTPTMNNSLYWYMAASKPKSTIEYMLKLNIEEYAFLTSNTKIYVFYKGKIYTLDKEENLLKLLNTFVRNKQILIPEDKIEEFKKYIMPHIKYFKSDENSDNKVQVVGKLASKVMLDVDDKGNILLELKFCYQNYEFNILDSSYSKYVEQNNIVRDIPAETEVIKKMLMDGFEYVKGRKDFMMKDEESIYDFLSQKIERYMNDFEVLVTDKFKNKQIKQPKISRIGIQVNNGLLELDLSKININIDEIKDVLKDYSIKKKYHKLKNGDFLDLSDNVDLNLLSEMSTTLDIDYSKATKGIVDLPINRSFYLEKLMDSNKEVKVSKNQEFSDIVENMENPELTNQISIDKKFENILRDYQKTGFKWLKTLEKYNCGGILADDMGLGKTLQIISLLQSEQKNKKRKPSIVVCPSTLTLNWKAEIEKWCNTIKVLIVKGTAKERKEQIEEYKDYDLIITSYDLLKRDIDNYEGMEFKYIIADEAQYIKNSLTQNATSLKSLKGETKFALTGTPIENSVAELWSIFDFIMPGYLYNYNKFRKKFEEPILKLEDRDALNRLKKLISPFVLRRVKEDVLTELPDKNITILKNEMDKEQEKIYLSYLAQTRKEISEELQDNGFEKSKFKILMLLTRLRQICCHPHLFLENYNGGSGKLEQCMDLVKDAVEGGHKILIFSSYTSMFEIMEKELDKLNINYFKLVGDTPVGKRIEMVDEFNNSKSTKVFLISLKAGGTGLNLTSADIVIHYDPWWNVSSENQATDRAYRIGQKNSVQVYKLITTNSIEEKINKMQERKAKLSKDILSTEETFISKMSKDEILDLFE